MASEPPISPESDPLIAPFRQRLELALIHHLGARGDSLGARIEDLGAELPDDLGRMLGELDRFVLEGQRSSGKEACAEYAFRCGRAVERIERYARDRAAEDLYVTGADGRPLADGVAADLDTLSRFRVARDRFLRKAADFSLKILVGSVVLLVLGFVLGLI